ncbi:hypothetical protein HanPSC8_Chr11g0460971 [Helianthus annuus]|nr:hypothetical protein HanPSC8_Chr11g0460971 [Helianthus annuus]
MKQSDLNFEKSYFSLQIPWPLGCNLGVGEETHGTSSILLQTAYGGLGHRPGRKNAYFY